MSMNIRGDILPLALIMTFTMLLAGIGIGIIVLQEVQRAQDTDQSVAAYYMADSGVERQLYELRKNNQTLAYTAGLSSSYPNAGRWVSTAGLDQTMQKMISTVTPTNFTVVDLFDPDNLAASANVDEVRISWTGSAQMDVGYAQWTSGSTVIWPTDANYVQQLGFSPSMSITGLDPSKAYRMRLRAVNGTATNVAISVYRHGAIQSFPGDITLSAEGTYGNATQKISVSMPKLDVLSGLYGYVVFSECQLLKGVSGTPVCPP